nr:DNA-3-methyladenine glycosylase I [Ramlibacter montanisoli]
MTKPPQRCAWAEGGDALMAQYHDEEWGVPQHDPRMLWEMLMLEGFQAGLSWRTVLHKREAFRRAFAGFEPAKVARFVERRSRSCWPILASSARAPRSSRPSPERGSTAT